MQLPRWASLGLVYVVVRCMPVAPNSFFLMAAILSTILPRKTNDG
jgi:hypothetical protein